MRGPHGHGGWTAAIVALCILGWAGPSPGWQERARATAPPPQAAASSEPAGLAPPERPLRREYDAKIRILGDVTVERDEQVNGAVVAVGGSVRVDGRVREDVVAVGGGVRLGPHAEVTGDVVTVGGTIDRDPEAVVGGKLTEVAVSAPGVRIRPRWDLHWMPWFGAQGWGGLRLFGTALRMTLAGLLIALVVLVAPVPVRRVERVVVTQPWAAALTGLLAELCFVPVLVVAVIALVISIVGIPLLLLLVPFAALALGAALVIGLSGSACGLGRLVWRRSQARRGGLLADAAVGLAVVWGLTLIGRFVGLAGWPLNVAAGALVAIGALIEYAAWTLGLGAALLTRFGTRGETMEGPVGPAPPVSGEAA